jgi:hypothetical protein
MASSGVLRRVAHVRTHVSEERSACIIRVTRIDELGITLAVSRNRSTLPRNIMFPSMGKLLVEKKMFFLNAFQQDGQFYSVYFVIFI